MITILYYIYYTSIWLMLEYYVISTCDRDNATFQTKLKRILHHLAKHDTLSLQNLGKKLHLR